jgi:hypothetical protein
VASVASFTPVMAFSGRRRFGGRKAASLASASSRAIGEATAGGGAAGNERIQAPPPAAASTAAPRPAHNICRLFMASSNRVLSHLSPSAFGAISSPVQTPPRVRFQRAADWARPQCAIPSADRRIDLHFALRNSGGGNRSDAIMALQGGRTRMLPITAEDFESEL